MIWESWPWKKELLATAKRLHRFKRARRLIDDNLAQIERDIFVGFYSVRKLCETITKLTDATKSMQVQLSWYPNLRPVNWRNNHRIDELDDLAQQHGEIRDITFISNQIIHSFIFLPCVEEDGRGLREILFTSDTKKDKKLYSMRIDDVIKIFECVGNDDPIEIHWSEDPTGKETTIVS